MREGFLLSRFIAKRAKSAIFRRRAPWWDPQGWRENPVFLGVTLHFRLLFYFQIDIYAFNTKETHLPFNEQETK